ncbi:MAG TPA: DUF6259 domain-containing protein [Gaiellaceae bacterium]|nr:DUF6259 domain-containing protein [Gaiellaceae bacterium]
MGVLATAAAAAAVLFSQQHGQLVVKAPAYRLVLSATNGRILELDDARGRTLLGAGYGCLWWLNPNHHATSQGGCGERPGHRWNARTSTLTLTYPTVTVTVHATRAYVDLRMQLRSTAVVRDQIRFPAGLVGDTRTVQAGYAPDVLPGVRLSKAFFSRVGNPVQIYPSRWAFADWLALDVNGGHVALYTVNRGPIAPASLGFLHRGTGSPCSNRVFCVFHEFETWVKPGTTWRSPIVRVRVGETAQQAILAYRHDNGIDAYPSLASKLGAARLEELARAPLVKADVSKLGLPFAQWGPKLAQLPSPILLHPVAYEPGGHDENDPDFLPPDPRWGTTADLGAAIAQAHADGDLVMPYDNLSWWDPSSPTMQTTTPEQVGALDESGTPQRIDYGTHTGVIVSPFAQLVRQRIAQELDTWSTLGADCVFVDQVGARPWLYDFNPATPSPLAYDDGWLALLAPYRDDCVMAEDGWDRLAADVVGFHGGLLMMQRELAYVDHYFGAGNWQPYPLATWLVHDKVLMYQHDLFPLTMARDAEVLTWNLAFGLVDSYEWWLGDEQDTWLELAARLQRDLGPHYAGVPLRSYTTIAPGVTRSVFGDLTVDANWNDTAWNGIAPHGFRAQGPGVSAVAQPDGSFVVSDAAGTAQFRP